MIVHAKRTQVAPIRAPASIDHACNRCAAGENDHVLLSLLDYHTKSPSPCQGGNRISFSLFFPGTGVCIFLLRRPLQGAGIRAAGRPGCAGANGLRPFRRRRAPPGLRPSSANRRHPQARRLRRLLAVPPADPPLLRAGGTRLRPAPRPCKAARPRFLPKTGPHCVVIPYPGCRRCRAAGYPPGTPAKRRRRWRCGSSYRRSPAAVPQPRCRRRR